MAATNLTDPQADSVTAVSGSWVVPTVSASSSNGRSYSAVWVGIDGYNDSTVEQIGTSQNVVNGRAEYEVWWEMYSSGKQQPEQVVSSMTIEPGDSISASVQYINSGVHAGDFYLTITDNSRAGDSFSIYVSSAQTQSPAAERSSAEWVVEAPSLGNNVADLSDFGTVTFTSTAATINGVTGSIAIPPGSPRQSTWPRVSGASRIRRRHWSIRDRASPSPTILHPLRKVLREGLVGSEWPRLRRTRLPRATPRRVRRPPRRLRSWPTVQQ